MTHDDIEPLDPATWLRQFEQLAARPKDGKAFARSCRHAFHLAQLTPRPLRHIIRPLATEQEFESFLKGEAFACAAFALVGDQFGYRVIQSPNSRLVEAEVWFPGARESHRARGPSAGAALLQAWLECILSLDESSIAAFESFSLPIPPEDQSARHRRSTEH